MVNGIISIQRHQLRLEVEARLICLQLICMIRGFRYFSSQLPVPFLHLFKQCSQQSAAVQNQYVCTFIQ